MKKISKADLEPPPLEFVTDSRGDGWYCRACNGWNPKTNRKCRFCGEGRVR